MEPANTVLPIWRRLLLAAVLPTCTFYVALFFYSEFRRSPARHFVPGGPSGSQLDVIVPLMVFGVGMLVFAFPIALCSIRMAFRPWHRWYTAICGGLIGVLVGLLMGGSVLSIIHVLTKGPR